LTGYPAAVPSLKRNDRPGEHLPAKGDAFVEEELGRNT
jgi:hypothetical protein